MKRHLLWPIGLLAMLALAAGCKDVSDGEGTAALEQGAQAAKPVAAEPQTSPGKPTAPISIDYDIIGVPIVGHPVNVDIRVSSTQGEAPVKLSWHVLDTGSLAFPESQLREVAVRVNPRQSETRQVTVVPQREGRLYLNVTAEVETPDGAMLKTIAIPIQVGNAPGEPEPEGEVKQDAEGEAIESLPADGG
ncbi:MAG TPA: hypothetical protein VFG91_13870 [Woeseiaceae bacterium]|nr:hypothetical protein [Woeseiaceae bacterium]